MQNFQGPIFKDSPLTGPGKTANQLTEGPDLQSILRFFSYDYVIKFVIRSTYDNDLQRAKISLRNIKDLQGPVATLGLGRKTALLIS